MTVLQADAEKLCAIFVLEPFQKLLSLFDPSKAVEVWKNVMEAFAAVTVLALEAFQAVTVFIRWRFSSVGVFSRPLV